MHDFKEGIMSFTTTDRALELAKVQKGSRILDIGCGDGDVVAYLAEKCGMEAEGIDINLEKVSAAKEKHPGINVKFGDGEFLDDYSSFTFDCIFMQDVLALIKLPDEALHEAYCVLKKGGRLIIIDDCFMNPDPKQLRALHIEAERLSRRPRKEGDCADLQDRFVDFRLKQTLFTEPLTKQIKDLGYKLTAFETSETTAFEAAEEPADSGTSAKQKLSAGPEADSAAGKKQTEGKTGRFLLVAEKPL
jgi:ubiquinone/menaquinone biosynthesis C-methylase UbiE